MNSSHALRSRLTLYVVFCIGLQAMYLYALFFLDIFPLCLFAFMVAAVAFVFAVNIYEGQRVTGYLKRSGFDEWVNVPLMGRKSLYRTLVSRQREFDSAGVEDVRRYCRSVSRVLWLEVLVVLLTFLLSNVYSLWVAGNG